MAERSATRSPRLQRTLCLPIDDDRYRTVIDRPQEFRRLLDDCFRRMPELFPSNFARGYRLKDRRVSAKRGLPIRRVRLRDGSVYSVRPSFLMPYLTARTEDVEDPLFLRKFGVPFWALARVFGRDPMAWYRLECGLGRFSVVGTTARHATLPRHLLADEHHQSHDGQKTYIATTVGSGCCLGAEPAPTAGTDDLKAAYSVFREEARDVVSDYAPATVNTDGWKWTQAAWRALFRHVVVIQCFLHAWLKVRDRAKHLGPLFAEVSRRIWEAYQAPDRRCFAQRLRSLRRWAGRNVTGVVLEKVLDLCSKRDRWSIAYHHPGGHRTSNMLDRIMRGMSRYFEDGQHLHGSFEASQLHCRAWALLWNFAPWSPATTRANDGWRCPAERLNRHRYHDSWLQNLLISASLGGYRGPLPQNP